MALAAFKDLCLDASDADRVGSFWADALGGERELLADGDALVRDPHLGALWVNTVAEAKRVKNRVHLDVYVRSVEPLLALGATVVAEREVYSVLADPEGNELCAFADPAPGPEPPEPPLRPFALCVDSPRPAELATWWAAVLGGQVGPGPDGVLRYVHAGAGFGDLVMKFVPVDDERVVKNRCHWDVTTADVAALVEAGATLLRARGAEIGWTVLTDPQGNEFCAFEPP